MATIDNLVVSFVQMTTKEQFDMVMDIRQRRRTKPINPRKFKRNAKGKSKAKAKIKGSTSKLTPDALLTAMSAEDKAKLLKELGVS